MLRFSSLSNVLRIFFYHVLPDLILVSLSLNLSLFLRFGDERFFQEAGHLNRLLPLFLGLLLATFFYLKVYRIIWRYMSLKDTLLLSKAVGIYSVLAIAATHLVDIGHLPRSTFFISAFLSVTFLGGIRFLKRIFHEFRPRSSHKYGGRATLIYGAGRYGRVLVQRFASDAGGFAAIGFVDDEPRKVGCYVAGLKVLGSGKNLARLIETHEIKEVVIAIEDPTAAFLVETLQVCRRFGIRPRMFKSIHRLVEKDGSLEVCREIDLGDLLNRPRREIDLNALRDDIEGKRVLVTGAGGSIGSELARQLSGLNPSQLILLDHSEFNLYQIDQMLRCSPADNHKVVPVLADLKDRELLEEVFRKYCPHFVFHAAAYKHVHLVEANPHCAISNNVMGTKNLLDLSESSGVESFVLISTDKAVNPAGVMGATKRLCELMVTEVGERTGRRFASVRFGNVLGSSGSLVPLLKKQIEEENLVTITDERMTRYFMLIPEAVSLVLKAASIAKPADIMVLKMGEPVRIVDVAKSLIALMGKGDDEVAILYTGLRPGEKLFEELYLSGNELQTGDSDILVIPRGDDAVARGLSQIIFEVERLIEAARLNLPETLNILREMVRSEYYVPVEKNRPLIQEMDLPRFIDTPVGRTARPPNAVA